jgi:hypothetical protein
MYCILVIGATGQGKSPFIRSYLEGKKCFVFDTQNEYGFRTKYEGQVPVGLSDITSADRARFTVYDVRQFIKICFQKVSTIIVFEDATMYFEGRTAEEMRRLLGSKRFTNNNYLLTFHSISAVPPRLMQFSDYVVLFKTGDDEREVERKYRKLLPAFKNLQSLPDGSRVIIKTI